MWLPCVVSLLLIVSSLGASGLLARAVAQDDIGEPIRERWRIAWIWLLGPRHKLIRPRTGALWKFIGCHRCVGFWTAVLVFTLAYFHGCNDWFLWPAMTMAAAFTTSLLIDAVGR